MESDGLAAMNGAAGIGGLDGRAGLNGIEGLAGNGMKGLFAAMRSSDGAKSPRSHESTCADESVGENKSVMFVDWSCS